MPSVFSKLKKKKLIKFAPQFVEQGLQYEVILGSIAYGVSSDVSDLDVYGFCIPPKEVIFPHLKGEIPGFDTIQKRFEQFEQHHVYDSSALAGKGQKYDVTIYSIVKYFRLLVDNNPNIIDSLFVPRRCIIYSTKIGETVRENRDLFLHKGAWHKFKGYAYSQMAKIKQKKPEGRRKKIVVQYGYDIKFAYHVVRLLNEIEQILLEGTLDLEKNKEQLKSIRQGEWSLEQVESYFLKKEAKLEELYVNSRLPIKPDEIKIKALLINCLEEHYGSLKACLEKPDVLINTLREIQVALRKIEDQL